jgi:hypothetical protein
MYFSNSTVKSSRNIFFPNKFNYDQIQNIDLSVTFFNLSLFISHTHASVVTDKLNRLLLISTSK